jgi:rhodanese-related sulfurtransferase
MTVPIRLRELSPAEIHELMRKRSIVLVDVREQQEHAVERIDGALLFPLSSFDPSALPSPEGREVVFHCGSGKRSAMAVAQCLKRGFIHTAHMAGGIQAWKAAGLPTAPLATAR